MAKTVPKKATEELYAWDAEKAAGGVLLCGVGDKAAARAQTPRQSISRSRSHSFP